MEVVNKCAYMNSINMYLQGMLLGNTSKFCFGKFNLLKKGMCSTKSGALFI